MLRWTMACSMLAAGIARADDKADKGKEIKGPEIKWTKTLKESLSAAKGADKIVMVDIYTDWCGWCKELDKKTYTDGDVVKLCNEQLISCKLDGEKGEGEEVVKKFMVHGFPAILFLDGSGELVGRISGFMPPKKFLQSVTSTLKSQRDLPVYLARFKEKGADFEAAIRLAEIYATRGVKDKAREYLDAAEKRAKPGDVQLAKGFNAVADVYQEAEEFDTAIALFSKAIKASDDAEQKSYGQGSIAACYWSMQKLKECKIAAEKTIAIEGASKEMVDACKQMLKQIGIAEEQMKKAREERKARDAKKEAAKEKDG